MADQSWPNGAWRIIVKRDLSEVALKRGVSPDNPQEFAPYAAAINLLAGSVMTILIVGVLVAYYEYSTWSAAAGMTVWLKIIADFILSRHAHPLAFKNKPK